MEVVHEPLCGNGCVEAGREGVRPGRRAGASQDGGDGPRRGPRRPTRSWQLREHLIDRAGQLGGDGGDRGLLEAVLLPAGGRRVRGDAGQRPAGQEPAGPQERCLRRNLAGSARRARAGPGIVRAAGADPRAAGFDPDPDDDDPGTGPGDPTVGEAAGGRRDQVVQRGQRHHRGVRAVDAAGPDRRATRPGRLADLAKRRLRAKIPELTEALTGRFSEHHAFLARMYLEVDRPTDPPDRGAERADRGGDGAVSVVLRADRHHPRDRATLRGGDRGRDRRRHERLPDRRAPGVVGGDLPGQQRVRRPDQIDRHPTRKRLPEGRARRGRVVGRQHPRHLPGGEVQADRRPPRTQEGPGRGRARHLDRGLDHGPHRRPLRRPRSRLLHPPRPRTPQEARAEPAPTPRLRRHPHPTRRNSLKKGCATRGNLRVRGHFRWNCERVLIILGSNLAAERTTTRVKIH